MDNQNIININFDNILDVALMGVRRSSAFMGFGVNAAIDVGFNKYQLTEITCIQLLPMDLSNESVNQMKQHFLTWIVGCGLRELIESFSIFLDHVYLAITQVAIVKDGLLITIAEKNYRQFQHDGIKDKLATLKNNYNIEPKHPSYIAGINQARNCLTHRRGIVETRDCFGSTTLRINWLGMDMLANMPNEKEFVLELPLKEPVKFEEGGTISVRFVEREVHFKLGELIKMEPKALAEICSYITFEAKEVVNSAINFCKAKGIQVQETDTKREKPSSNGIHENAV
jgi:hypothetical protein